MRVVIIGGNECMACVYKDICNCYGCKAKVFTKMRDGMKYKIGSPDLMIVFTNTVSHKMVQLAMCEAKRGNTPIAHCHSSSASALRGLLETKVQGMGNA